MKKDLPEIFCSVFIDELDGPGTWSGMAEEDKFAHVAAYRNAYAKTYGTVTNELKDWTVRMCDAIGIRYEIILGPGRSRQQVATRRAIAYVLRRMSGVSPSLSDIASVLGRNHHTSIKHQYEFAERLVESGDAEFLRLIEVCRAAIAPQGVAA